MAQTMAKALWDNFIVQYGLLEKTLSDQGRNFESKLIANLCKLMGTKKHRTSPYDPQTNGQHGGLTPPLICWGCCLQSAGPTERAVLEHWSMLTIVPKIPPWASAPISSCMGDNPDSPQCHSWTYPKINNHAHLHPVHPKLWDNIRWTHRKADLFQQKEAWHHKHNYDKHSKAVSLRMGDMVLVCVTAFKGRHKIQSRWENMEYVVEWLPYPNLPVYVVHLIDGEGSSHTLHQNFLLPISHNLEQEEGENVVEGVVVRNPPKCHMQRMHYQSISQPKVNWRAYLIHHQSSTNQLTQD